MPQMSPLNWLSLYMIFTITFVLFCVMNYYSYLPSTSQGKTSEKSPSSPLTWKW